MDEIDDEEDFLKNGGNIPESVDSGVGTIRKSSKLGRKQAVEIVVEETTQAVVLEETDIVVPLLDLDAVGREDESAVDACGSGGGRPVQKENNNSNSNKNNANNFAIHKNNKNNKNTG